MKRSLHVIDELRDPPLRTPRLVRVGNRVVSVVDTADGLASRRFADALIETGATRLSDESDARPDLRIVIRGAAASAEARLGAEVLEEAADLVLGSPRRSFARLLGSACARSVND